MNKKPTYEELQKRVAELEKQVKQDEDGEERYRTILDSIEEGYFEVSLRGQINFFNKAACRITGYFGSELKGMDNRQLMDEENAKKVFQVFNGVYRTGKPTKAFDWEIIKKDGSGRHIEASVSLITHQEGKPVGFRGIVRDVTERKQAEKALKGEKEKFRIIVEESPLGVSLINQDGHYEYINPKFTEIFGYTLTDVPIGREWFYRAYPDPTYREQVISTWVKDFKESKIGESRPRTFSAVCKDGSEKVINFMPVTMSNGGQFIIYEDITEQKQLEAQIQQTQKMEAIGRLAGGIAHDFNNLLMGIQGRISLMLMDTDTSHPHREHLEGIEDYVRSAADLTKQLLGFARSGKYEVKPTDLNKLLRESSEMFGRTKKEITIHARYQEDIWPVEVDRGQLSQVLLNLFVNAWQAMPGGGALFLGTENVVFYGEHGTPFGLEPGKYVKITVNDTGVGMDDVTMKRIFDPFFTTKDMVRGTGLGLASAYGIIRNHGGIITVSSDKGKGSTLTVYLPASEKRVREKKESSKKKLRGSETVLLVDDEEMIINVGKAILKSLGYHTLSAKGGNAAIKTYKDNKDRIDLIILDMIMPDIGGGETYDKLKEMNPNIKVLLSSGYSIDGQAKEILGRGCNGFLQKPFSVAALSIKIREILDTD